MLPGIIAKILLHQSLNGYTSITLIYVYQKSREIDVNIDDE